MSLADLPEPSFIDRDPVAITAAMIATYEEMAGRTLYPAQVYRLTVTSPADRVLASWEWAQVTDVQVTLTGVADG